MIIEAVRISFMFDKCTNTFHVSVHRCYVQGATILNENNNVGKKLKYNDVNKF